MDLKEKIKAVKLRLEPVDVPEYPDCQMFLKRMSGSENEIYSTARIAAADESKTKGDVSFLSLAPLLLSLCLCDGEGKRVFDDTKDLAATLDAVVLGRLANRALVLNALTVEASDEVVKKA